MPLNTYSLIPKLDTHLRKGIVVSRDEGVEPSNVLKGFIPPEEINLG